MNILVDEFAELGSVLLQMLAGYRNVSLYLSASRKDTDRIIREVKPELILTHNEDVQKRSYLDDISQRYPALMIYTYSKTSVHSSRLIVKDFRSKQCIPLSQIVNQ